MDLPECDSTNTYASDLSGQGNVPEGTVIITSRQFLGRGQRGNTWQTQDGANLTFSILLYPRFLEPSKQFMLSQAIALGIWDMVTRLGIPDAAIKWPNDIMVDGKKVCGILIENQVRGQVFSQSIVGIGLNVNQKEFQHPQATSISLVTGKPFELNWMLGELLKDLEARYFQLKQQPKTIASNYLDRLYWRGEQHTFMAGDATFSGTIETVDSAGRLVVRRENNGVTLFAPREISFVQ